MAGMTLAIIGTAAAVGGTVVTASQANRSNKEMNRQKSIAADQKRIQDEEIAKQKQLALDEEKALQDELVRKQRETAEKNAQVSENVRKRQARGRRSLIYGSETGVNDYTSDTLG